MDRRELLSDLHRHMEWADGQVWIAVLGNSAASGDDELRGRLQHIHLVQQAFFSIWRGEPVDAKAGEGLAAAALAALARPYYPAARRWLLGVEEAGLDAAVTLPWGAAIAARLGFEPAVTTLAETALQVTLHTGHHRGQVTRRLRELGVEPPLVDYIAWLWRGRPPAVWPAAAG